MSGVLLKEEIRFVRHLEDEGHEMTGKAYDCSCFDVRQSVRRRLRLVEE